MYLLLCNMNHCELRELMFTGTKLWMLTIFILQYMIQANLLTSSVLRASSPHDSTDNELGISFIQTTGTHLLLHLLCYLLVNGITEVFNGALSMF